MRGHAEVDGFRRAGCQNCHFRCRFEQPEAYQAAGQLLDSASPPDALFVANEPMALGVLDAIKERGLRVPDDVALIGFDDTPWMAYVSPPITTVAQPTYSLGREAVRLLMRRLAEPDAPCLTVTLPTELVVRESCGYRKRA